MEQLLKEEEEERRKLKLENERRMKRKEEQRARDEQERLKILEKREEAKRLKELEEQRKREKREREKINKIKQRLEEEERQREAAAKLQAETESRNQRKSSSSNHLFTGRSKKDSQKTNVEGVLGRPQTMSDLWKQTKKLDTGKPKFPPGGSMKLGGTEVFPSGGDESQPKLSTMWETKRKARETNQILPPPPVTSNQGKEAGGSLPKASSAKNSKRDLLQSHSSRLTNILSSPSGMCSSSTKSKQMFALSGSLKQSNDPKDTLKIEKAVADNFCDRTGLTVSEQDNYSVSLCII